MIRIFTLLAASLLFCGCFVFDELDAGMEIMDSHSPNKKQKTEAAKATTEAEAPPDPSAWWSKSRSLGRSPGEASDPEDSSAPVPCQIQGATRFMRRGECITRGGTPRA